MNLNQTEHTPIAAAIGVLTGGDVITNLNCEFHQDHMVLVLGRNPDNTFDLSSMGTSPSILKDPYGPYRWDPALNTFLNKQGSPYSHINASTVVLSGAGAEEHDWYLSLPKAGSVPHMVTNETVTEALSPKEEAQTFAILMNSVTARSPSEPYDGLARMIELVTPGLDAATMNKMVNLLATCLAVGSAVQRLNNPMGSLLAISAGGAMWMGGGVTVMHFGGAKFTDPHAQRNSHDTHGSHGHDEHGNTAHDHGSSQGGHGAPSHGHDPHQN